MKYSRLISLTSILMGLFFCLFVIIYDRAEINQIQGRIDEHALVISDDLWNFNSQRTWAYLLLASESDDFKNLTVFDRDDKIFQEISIEPVRFFDRLFLKLRLIPSFQFRSEIFYGREWIGSLRAEWLCKTIYVHLYILFALVLINIVFYLYLKIFEAKVKLEDRVKERTHELAESNTALQQEINERKRAEDAYRRSEEKYRKLYRESKKAEDLYRSLIASSADGIAVYDMDGLTKYVSPAFTRMFGWTLEELKGKTIRYVPESEKEGTYALIRQLIENGEPCQNYETIRYTKDGSLMNVSISASRYHDHMGNPAGILVILRNITENKRMKTQLERAQRMEAIGTLAGGVAHDFNNILMGIQGRVSLMLVQEEIPSRSIEHLKSIEEYIKSASALAKQLLGFARAGRYEIKPTNINLVIEKTARMFGRTQKEIRIHLNLAEDIRSVEVDRNQMEQVFLNMFVNARQAMSGSGELFISTSNLFLGPDEAEVMGISSGNCVKISVADTGIGMDEETRRRVFDPFFTTKDMSRGTGLGMASAYGIIRGHGGSIDVESKPGDGAVFTIHLPSSEKTIPEEKPGNDEIIRGRETILLIDDEEIVIDVARELLKNLGYNVLIAKNGMQAIELYKNRGGSIDLVILDMVMPVMTGSETFERLKQLDPNVKVLLSSGYSQEGEADKIMKRGCVGFLQKPFNIEFLSKKIRESL